MASSSSATTEIIKWISIDVGRKNFAIRVEGVSAFAHPFPVLFELVNLGSDTLGIDHQTLTLTAYFQQHFELLHNCHVLLVEQQRLIGRQITNATSNMRIMQHIFSYFQQNHPHIQRIELPPTVKTMSSLWLNCDPIAIPRARMTKPDRKKWGYDTAIIILKSRGDQWSIDVIESAKDKYDLTDTIVQLVAYQRWYQNKAQAGQSTEFTIPSRKRKTAVKKP